MLLLWHILIWLNLSHVLQLLHAIKITRGFTKETETVLFHNFYMAITSYNYWVITYFICVFWFHISGM